MKKRKALELAGSGKALAELLGVSQSAVSQWSEELPQQRVWQLKVLRPEWFSGDAAMQGVEVVSRIRQVMS